MEITRLPEQLWPRATIWVAIVFATVWFQLEIGGALIVVVLVTVPVAIVAARLLRRPDRGDGSAAHEHHLP